MTTPTDPRMMSRHTKPAYVITREPDRTRFVADAEMMDGGWLQMRKWSGGIDYLPRERVSLVERVERERVVDDDTVSWRVVSAEEREAALRESGIEDDGVEVSP